jgi:hypothetical protein
MQITIDPELRRRAQAKAASLGISFAEYARRLLASDLGDARPKWDPSLFIGLGASAEPTDVARDKDKMVAQAVWEEYQQDVGLRRRRPTPDHRRGKKPGKRRLA